MEVIDQYFEIIDDFDEDYILKKIEKIARTCYKSEDKITDDGVSARNLVRGLIKSGHTAMLEHVSISVKFITDRAVSHELVRHRLCSFAQESQRYVNYDKKGIIFIRPVDIKEDSEEYLRWEDSVRHSANEYCVMIKSNLKPEIARSVLPNSTKTEIVVTANLREWRHIFNLRSIGVTGRPHPQMKDLMDKTLFEFAKRWPIIFKDQALLVFKEEDFT